MYVLRPITLNDLDAFCDLAFSAKEAITTLPKSRDLLQKNLHNAVLSFKGNEPKSAHTLFLFVLEDLESKALIGVSALKSDNAYTATYTSFYFKGNSPSPTSLDLFPCHTPFTELATLYLRSEYRKTGLAKLLATGRYHYVSRYPEQFHETFIARLRGFPRPEVIHPSFWEQMGSLFDLQPYYPIHVNKFTKEVQELIGQVHPKTIPAYHMLLKEGFFCNQIFDMYDTGPRVECKKNEIRSIKLSQVAKIESIEDIYKESPSFVISNTAKDFKATLGEIRLSQKNQGHVIISDCVSKVLSVNSGDCIRYVPSNPPPQEI